MATWQRLGAFIALAVVTSLGVSPLVALPVAILATAGVAVGIDKVFYEHLRERPKIVTVMASLGIALMVRSVVQVVWGVDTQTYTRGIVRPEDYFGLRIRDRELYTVVAMLVLVGGLHTFPDPLQMGQGHAGHVGQSEPGVAFGHRQQEGCHADLGDRGRPVRRSRVFPRSQHGAEIHDGLAHAVPHVRRRHSGRCRPGGREPFSVGLIVGIAEELSVLFIPSEYKAAMAFAILLFMLLVRPTGLLKGKVL